MIWLNNFALLGLSYSSSSSSRMRVIYHNWSAMKQRPHPQSVAEISHHSVLSGGRIRQCEKLLTLTDKVSPSSKYEQELSYRKQIARHLRTQYVYGIYDNPVTLNF